MTFAITANFLLGTYQGSDSGGNPESYPSPDRLYKACVAAAYNTFDFEKQTDDRVLTDDQINHALAWLEDNPPRNILLPRVIQPISDAVTFKKKGYLEKDKKSKKGLLKEKKSSDRAFKAMVYCQNAAESLLLTWQWDETPSQEIANTLDMLCGEVPYLGEACSLVELRVQVDGNIPEAQRDKTWTLEEGSMLSRVARGNRVFVVPGAGRLEDLKLAYATANPEGKGKGKNAAKPKVETKEDEQNFLNDYVPKETEDLASYRPPFFHSEQALEAPWTMAIVMSVAVDEDDSGEASEWEPSESEYVGWAVALHRFLVRQWGVNPAPSLVGKYANGVQRPANNVAIQIFDSTLKSQYGDQLRDDVAEKLPGFLIMLPKDMPPQDMQKLCSICERAEGRSLYCSRAVPRLRLGKSTVIDAEHLWKPADDDHIRYWKLRPLAIAETRPMPDPERKRQWRVAESMYLALGHVWRDKYVSGTAHGTRESQYWATVDAVADQSSNFRIFNCRRVHRVNMASYAHHTNASNVLRAMNAMIAISDEGDSLDCAALAIGQSRHLGGGLLVPYDVPKSKIKPDEHFGKGVPA